MRFLSIILLVVLFGGCDTRENYQLQDGFEIIRVYGDAHSIVTPEGRELVMPNVVEVRDDKFFLVGLRKKVEPAMTHSEGVQDQPYGYFIYEKNTTVLELGLSYAEYNRLSKKKKINIHLVEL